MEAPAIGELLHETERRQLDADARAAFEEDAPGYLLWDTLDETMRAEYRLLVRVQRTGQ